MAIHIRRREFIVALGGATVWPLVAHAQQPNLPVIGFLNGGSPSTIGHVVVAFRQGLGEAGYVENRDFGIEYRWAEGQGGRLPALASELVRARVAVICGGSPPGCAGGKGGHGEHPDRFHERRGSHQIGAGGELQPARW